MSYQQQGYPQQQPQQPQQMGGYQSGGYPAADGPSPVLAVIAGILGLVAAAAMVVSNVKVMNNDGFSFSDMPGSFKTIFILRFAAALLLLIGTILVFLRKLAGAIMLVLGAVAAIAAVVLFPVLLKNDIPGLDMGEYYKVLFKFKLGEEDLLGVGWSAIALIAAPLTLIAAILPPTLNYLKGSRSDVDSGFGTPPGGYPQQQQPQGYGQQQGYGQGQQQGW